MTAVRALVDLDFIFLPVEKFLFLFLFSSFLSFPSFYFTLLLVPLFFLFFIFRSIIKKREIGDSGSLREKVN